MVGNGWAYLCLGMSCCFSGGNSADHFCWSSPVLQIFMKLLVCLFGGPWFLLFPSTAETSAWWSWRQEQGSRAKCLCAQTDALYWGVFMQITAVFSLQIPVPSMSNAEMPEEKQLTSGELPVPSQDAGQAEH